MEEKNFILVLQKKFQKKSNPEKAIAQKVYLRNQFEFFGMTSPIRKTVQKPFLIKQFLPPKESLNSIIKKLWVKPEREFQYFAQELFQKYQKQFDKEDIILIEYMILNKSWWDTVDFLASNLLGPYFKMYPDQQKKYVEKWIQSNNIWLQRSAIIYQLKYKEEVDTQILSYTINSLLGSKEFFINKAIGWSLRQYSRYNPKWVVAFVNQTPLENLSRREALRLLK